MRLSHRITILYCAAAAFLSSMETVGAEEFRSNSGHFRFQIPQNWVPLDALKAGQVKNAFLNRPNFVFHDGFQPRNLQREAVVIVMEERGKQSRWETFDQIERSLQTGVREGFLRGAGPNANLGPIVLDRAKNRFVAQLDVRAPNGVKVRGILFGFLGKDGIVVVLCMAAELDFPQQIQTFETMADSFRYDEGFQFVPFDVTKVFWIIGGVIASVCCLLSVIVLGVSVLIMFMMKR